MKRRVAVVSSCAPPLPGRPATGGGLRTWQLVETLRAAGHAVALLVEAAALPEQTPKEIVAFEPETLPAAIKAARASVIVVEQWALVAQVGATTKPLVVDLHGSLLLENVYRRGDVDYTMDAGAKLEALHRADLLLTPAPAQVHHFGAWLTLAGFDPRELPLALLPLAVPGDPTRRTAKKPPLRLVYGGARWPWIDSLDALQTVATTLESLDGGHLDLFTYDPPRHGLPLDEDLGTWAEVDAALLDHACTTHHRGVARSEYAEFLQQEATVALDLWSPNPERMLAATTRTGEFLHAGLPVITVAGSAWAEELLESGAGWTVPADDPTALSDLLRDLHAHPARIATASRAAVALMTNRHALDSAGQALLAFIQSPHRPPRSEQTLVESILAVRQAHLDETLRSNEAAHADEHARLVAAHRAEVEALRTEHRRLTDELTAHHNHETASLSDAHRAELARHADEHRAALDEVAAEHRERAETAEAASRAALQAAAAERKAEVEALAAEHRERADAAEAASRTALEAAAAERKAEVEALAAEARSAADRAVADRRQEVEALTADAKDALDRAVADRRQEVDALTEQSRQALEDADSRHRTEFVAAEARHREEAALIEARHREELAEAIAGHRIALEDARTAIERSAAELEAAVEEHRVQMETATAEHRTEMGAEAARHRAEIEEAVSSWQARLDVANERARSDRHQAREARTRLEVELRAELARTEERARAREQDVARTEAALDSVRHELSEAREALAQARATLAARLKGKLGSVDPLDALPGRAKPALHLAKLWVEHALDRGTRGPGPGEG